MGVDQGSCQSKTTDKASVGIIYERCRRTAVVRSWKQLGTWNQMLGEGVLGKEHTKHHDMVQAGRRHPLTVSSKRVGPARIEQAPLWWRHPAPGVPSFLPPNGFKQQTSVARHTLLALAYGRPLTLAIDVATFAKPSQRFDAAACAG